VNWDARAAVVTRTRERTYADVEPRPRPEIEHGSVESDFMRRMGYGRDVSSNGQKAKKAARVSRPISSFL